MPQVSIITPTHNRTQFLPAIWKCVREQSVHDFEWLVLDSSRHAAPIFESISDARVKYLHNPNRMTIGAMRNALCEAATGDIIALFDDDDFYAPHYIASMLSLMDREDADFVKLLGFYVYHRQHGVFGYWDLEKNLDIHYRFGPDGVIAGHFIPADGNGRLGFGFSFLFRRRVWEASHFLDQDWNEDGLFAEAAVRRFKFAGTQDIDCSCLHIVHTCSTSISYPQYLLPSALLARLFPGFHG